MNSIKRVVVTGISMITPLGNSKEEFFKNALNGASAISKIENFEVNNFNSKIGAFIKEEDFIDKKMEKKLITRTDKILIQAINQVIEDAGLNLKKNNNMGLSLSDHGDPYTTQLLTDVKLKKKLNVKYFFNKFEINGMAKMAALLLNLNGPVISISGGCASGNYVIADAYYKIKNNFIDRIIAGSINLLSREYFQLLDKLGLLSAKGSFPFDEKHDGIVLGEGAAFLILESLESAIKRKARIYGEVLSFGFSSGAQSIIFPQPTEKYATLAIKRSIDEANLDISQIDYISALGVGTKTTDIAETKAIKNVFGDYAYKIPISSLRPYIGHAMGAASAIDACNIFLMMMNKKILPTLNLEENDGECDLDYVPKNIIDKEIKIALNNGFGFGGNNSVAVFRSYND